MTDKTIQALIKAFDKTDELFFISKQGDKYEFIHSELSDAKEWIEMVDYFLTQLEEKVMDLKKGDDATRDLLDGFDINEN